MSKRTVIENARLANGQLASLTIEQGHFTAVVRQDAKQGRRTGALSLEEYAAASHGDQGAGSISGQLVDADGALIVPAAIDVHVHSRDPGHPAKEDWGSLAQAAFKGGVVAVVDMPNTVPATMQREQVIDKAQRAESSGLDFRLLLGVAPSNIGELASICQDPRLPLAGVKVYYGQSTGDLMFADLQALAQALPADRQKVVVFHSEDQCRIDTQLAQHQAELANDPRQLASYSMHSRIRDSASAWGSTTTILAWAQAWQRPIHLAHVSTPHEMTLVAEARNRGAVVTSEVAPHHLLLSTDDYPTLGGYLKVNPPVRSPEEVAALQQHFAAGAIDCFATDHAPHTRTEKEQPYIKCPSGLPAIEFFWPLFYTCVQSSGASLATRLSMVGTKPAELFGFPRLGALAEGYQASFVWLEEQAFAPSEADIGAKCGWSPYLGRSLKARVKATWQRGRCRYLG